MRCVEHDGLLVEGDDMNEPISDAARGILDGHIVLSRKLAERGVFPAISVQESISRVMKDVIDDEHAAAAAIIKEWVAAYRESEDIVQLGAYASGTNTVLDSAIAKMPVLTSFLKQGKEEQNSFNDSVSTIKIIAGQTGSGNIRKAG